MVYNYHSSSKHNFCSGVANLMPPGMIFRMTCTSRHRHSSPKGNHTRVSDPQLSQAWARRTACCLALSAFFRTGKSWPTQVQRALLCPNTRVGGENRKLARGLLGSRFHTSRVPLTLDSSRHYISKLIVWIFIFWNWRFFLHKTLHRLALLLTKLFGQSVFVVFLHFTSRTLWTTWMLLSKESR